MTNTMRVGTNLTPGFGPGVSENPFLNMMKSAFQWVPVAGNSSVGFTNLLHESYNLYSTFLDNNGYITTFSGAPFDGISTTYFSLKAGQHIFKYDGDGQFYFQNDGAYVSGANTGRIVIDVTLNGSGVSMTQYSTNTSNYAHNFRFCWHGDESAMDSGTIFTPEFSTIIEPFEALRSMKWFNMDGSENQAEWSDRLPPTYFTWFGSPKNILVNGADPNGAAEGVPVEVFIALCNQTGADAWVNVPPLASANYMHQMANTCLNGFTDTSGYTWSGLNSPQKLYVECGNEWWNQAFGGQLIGAITASIAGNVMNVTNVSSGIFTGSVSGNTLTLGGNFQGLAQDGCLLTGAGIPANTVLTGQINGSQFTLNQNLGTVTSQAMAVSAAGGPFLNGGVFGTMVADNSAVNLPFDDNTLILSQANGTPGGIGNYIISKTYGSIASNTYVISITGIADVATACYEHFPFLQPWGRFDPFQTNTFYQQYAACKSSDIFLDVWTQAGQGSRIVRVYGGFGGDDGLNQNNLPNSVAISGAETATFTGTIVGTSLSVSSVTGTIVAGHKITGAANATYIVSGSGTSWTVNKSQGIGPVSMSSQGWNGTVASNFDVMCVDAYFGDWSIPDNITMDQFFTELLGDTYFLNQTGTEPAFGGSSSALTLTSTAGNRSTPGSVPSTPADGTMVLGKFTSVPSGSSPTLAVDGGTAYPLMYFKDAGPANGLGSTSGAYGNGVWLMHFDVSNT